MSAAPMPPAAIAAAVEATRAILRLAGDDEDALLATLARAAIDLAERFVGSPLIVRTFEDVVAADGSWHPLRHAPVVAVVGATALPVGAAPFVLAVERYAIDIDRDACGWFRGDAGVPLAAVSYSAGLAIDWASLPAPIAHGVAMLAGHLFDARDADAQPPSAVAALWRPWRRMTLGSVEMRR